MHTYYTSHSHIHSHSYIILYNTLMHASRLHFFCSSWQAGCSRLFVSDTLPPNCFPCVYKLFLLLFFSYLIFLYAPFAPSYCIFAPQHIRTLITAAFQYFTWSCFNFFSMLLVGRSLYLLSSPYPAFTCLYSMPFTVYTAFIGGHFLQDKNATWGIGTKKSKFASSKPKIEGEQRCVCDFVIAPGFCMRNPSTFVAL